MLLGPGKDGYDIKIVPDAQRVVDRFLEEYPAARFWWLGFCDLLRTSGHIVGQRIHFRGRGHRLVSFAPEPSGLWPGIDLIYVIVADEVTIDFVALNIRTDE
jgi:hypothetical protein